MYLLDANVLIAILDAGHIHHKIAIDWFVQNSPCDWATCPTTENGFVRVMSSTSYRGGGIAVAAAILTLREFTKSPGHTFVADEISVLKSNEVDVKHILGSKLVTDIYLASLAKKQKMKLATMDRRLKAPEFAPLQMYLEFVA